MTVRPQAASWTWTYDVCVVGGLGHAGLPLAISFADAGKRVVVYDIDTLTLQRVAQGEMPFLENGAEQVLRTVLDKTLFLSDDKSVIAESHFVVIVLGTPVDKHLNPQFTLFREFIDGILDYLRPGQHVVLRSTVYPETTERIYEYLKSRGTGVRVSFCPERIAEGKAMEELRTLPQIVSGFDEVTMQEAGELFSALVPDIVRLRPIEAELAKLFSNVWRYLQFGVANQFYQIALQHDVDFYQIYSAFTFKYPRMVGLKTPGFTAGPCLFKDTMQLAAFSNNSFFLGHAAMLVNEGLPNLVVERLKRRVTLRDKVAGVLGMAFKAESDDKRDSLSYKLRKILEMEAREVLCSDCYINEPGFISPEQLIERCDIVIVGAPHAAYRDLSIPGDKLLVDVWNLYGKGGMF
jgi:UDP-N-acetyl-D-mannosaminuronic acid dehydrogenase